MNTKHTKWSSHWIFIMAAVGAAVGLGNIWKFPYMTGENGGGAFVLVYLFCILALGLPIMIAEITLGKTSGLSPVNTLRKLVNLAGASRFWVFIGWSGLLSAVLILSYYSVIAGWALAYIPLMLSGVFTNTDTDNAGKIFTTLTDNPWRLIFWHTIFMLMTAWVLAKGLAKGLERAISILLPGLFVLLICLVVYAFFSTDQFYHAFTFLFKPDFNALLYQCADNGSACQFTADGILSALGLAFFSLSLGMGSLMMYGAYLPKDSSITQAALIIVLADTSVAILAGLAIFPIVFAYGLDPAAGPGLVFVTLPIAFGHMPAGIFFGTLFFILLVFAAWTSAFSLLEPVVAWLVESKKLKRYQAVWLSAGVIWLVGLLSVLSFNLWSDVHPLAFLSNTPFATQNFFDFFDYLTSNIMLPLTGLAIGIFSVWVLPQEIIRKELNLSINSPIYRLWLFLVRYVTPIGISLVFLNSIGMI